MCVLVVLSKRTLTLLVVAWLCCRWDCCVVVFVACGLSGYTGAQCALQALRAHDVVCVGCCDFMSLRIHVCACLVCCQCAVVRVCVCARMCAFKCYCACVVFLSFVRSSKVCKVV